LRGALAVDGRRSGDRPRPSGSGLAGPLPRVDVQVAWAVVAVRLEIELTSSRDDGTWTWRAAGARQPKGVLDGKVLPEGAKVGDVLRAEAEQNIDGINVTSVSQPKTKSAGPERLEMIAKPEGPLVSASVT